MLTSEVLTMVVSRVDSKRLRHRLQSVSFMSRTSVCFGVGEPEGEQVQAPSSNVVPLGFDVLRLGGGTDRYGRTMLAFLVVIKYICGILGGLNNIGFSHLVSSSESLRKSLRTRSAFSGWENVCRGQRIERKVLGHDVDPLTRTVKAKAYTCGAKKMSYRPILPYHPE